MRLLLRVMLIAALLVVVFPHLPGVRFEGSVLMALFVALPFALLTWFGHGFGSSEPKVVGRRRVHVSSSIERLPEGAARWFVVGLIWVLGFLVVPGVLLLGIAAVPGVGLSLGGPMSALLPAVLFAVVHVVSTVSVSSSPPKAEP